MGGSIAPDAAGNSADAGRSIAAARTIAEIFAIQAQRHPTAAAILAPGRATLDYRALARHVDRTVDALAAAGIAHRKRVAVVLPNGPEIAVALLALLSSRATCAPLNPALDEQTSGGLLVAMRVDAIIVAAGEHSAPRRAAEALGLQILEMSEVQCQAAALLADIDPRTHPAPVAAPQPDDLAMLMATSGTTGKPKIIPVSHADLCAGMRRQMRGTQASNAHRCLCVSPLFTTSGIRRNLLNMLLAGGSVICPNAFRAAEFIDWIRKFEPTYYAAGPALHLAILEAHEHNGPIGPTSLQYVLSGATALPVDVEKRLERLLGAPVIQALGMSEAGLVATNPFPPGLRRPGSVGIPVELDVMIHDDTGAVLPAGEIGEVVIRGPGVIRGYENDPEANREAFRDGWFRTGDLGYFDNGYLYLTGRTRDIINRGGFKVSPIDVDAALLRHPDVVEAATFAVAHATLGEDVNAAVVVRNGEASVQDLRDFALEHLPHYKVPSQIVLVDALPKTALGKINRRELATSLAGALRGSFTAPRDVREERIARLFAAALGLPAVGANDNFFHLGGDSLRGAQVIAQLNDEIGSRVPATLLFRRPTVAEFAAALESDSGADVQPALPPLVARARSAQAETKSKGGHQS